MRFLPIILPKLLHCAIMPIHDNHDKINADNSSGVEFDEAKKFMKSIRSDLIVKEKKKFNKRQVDMEQCDGEYTSMKAVDSCELSEQINIGRVVLLKLIATTANSTIHFSRLIPSFFSWSGWSNSFLPTIRTNTGHFVPNDLVIKYEWDCLEWKGPQSEHPLVAEYVMMKYIYSKTQIGPEPIYLSHAFLYAENPNMKFYRPFCPNENNPNPSLRFLVMTQLGLDLAIYSSAVTILPPYLLFQLFHSCLVLLESMHSLGLIHGDIHSGNIAFRSVETLTFLNSLKANPTTGKPESGQVLEAPSMWKDGRVDVTLLDFGLSQFLPSTTLKVPSPVLSKWELAGSPPSMRDDLFRLFEIMATVFQGESVLAILNGQDEGAKKEWKNRANFFDLGETNSLTEMKMEKLKKLSVEKTLALMMKMLLKLEFDELPDYEKLKNLCIAIIKLVKPKEVSEIFPKPIIPQKSPLSNSDRILMAGKNLFLLHT